jgi:hypothetical protein
MEDVESKNKFIPLFFFGSSAGASRRDTTEVLAARADGDVGHAPGWFHVDGQRR